jgi:carbohydrate-selective porin OprB
VPYNSKGVAGAPNASNVNYTYAFYLQADQMLYRAPNSNEAPITQVIYDGKNTVGKNVTTPASSTHSFSKKGLYEFAMFTFSPQSEQQMPEYFQVGLVYQGLIPHRDNDKLGIAFGAGFFSPQYNSFLNAQNNYATARASSGILPKPFNSTESVLEAFYLIQANKWLSVKPYVQFINNPVGNGTVQSDWILGGAITAAF